MGYGVRAGMVEENKGTLELILQAVSNNSELRLEIPSEKLSAQQWNIRRILKATEMFPNEAGGRYCRLGKLVRTRTEVTDTGKAFLIIVPAQSSLSMFVPASAIILHVAQVLDNFSGEITIIKIPASLKYDEQEIVEQAAQRGFTVDPAKKSEGDNEVWYVAERTKSRSAAMERLGFNSAQRRSGGS